MRQRKHQISRADRAGMGLLELLFFLTLVVMGVWIAMAAARQSGREARRTEERLTWTQATTLAFEHLEHDLMCTTATRPDEVDVPGDDGGPILNLPIRRGREESLITYRFDKGQRLLWREESDLRTGRTQRCSIPYPFGDVRFQISGARVVVLISPLTGPYETAVDSTVRFEGRLPTLSLSENYPELAPLPAQGS